MDARHAPLDDEPETDEERRAVADARADRARGVEPIPLEDVLAECGAQCITVVRAPRPER